MSDQESDLEFGFGYAAQLEDRIVKLQDENTRLRSENLCDACAGAGEPISGKPCMCGGTGKMSDAAIYLRSKLIDAEEENARLRAAIEPTQKNLEKYDCAIIDCDDDIERISEILSSIAYYAGLGVTK